MPVIIESSYAPPKRLRNKNLHTLYPRFLRKLPEVQYERERMYMPYNDFVDLDWSRVNSKRLVVILHGIEGSSEENYMKGMALAFNSRKWDAVCYNLRGCSGEPNKEFRSYHAGDTEDLEAVLKHIVYNNKYIEICLVGFGIGGNVLLKYAGEKGMNHPPILKKIVAISVPCDLQKSVEHLSKQKRFWTKLLLRKVRKRLFAKQRLFPDKMQKTKILRLRNLKDLDDYFTAPANGFQDAQDYWHRNSSKPLIPKIRIPTLLISSLDDPFLPNECYPIVEANNNKFVFFETPRHGGHIAFVLKDAPHYWHELRALNFIVDDDLYGKKMKTPSSSAREENVSEALAS